MFGKVVEGMDVVTRISEVATDADDRPLKPIMMKSITITF